jgi:malonate-semialdehyde dehydrogenase (acetylating)/methylmalonate-semialdehyde dehydrogenase
VKFFTRGKVVTQRWPRRTAAAAASFHFSGDAKK